MFHSDPMGEAACAGEVSEPRACAPDFVVIDVETSCSRVSSICQIGIVGFRDGRVIFEYETLLDPRDHFSGFNTRIHGIAAEHVVGQPCFADVHAVVDGHLTGRITVAHSYFDKGALAAACRQHWRPMIETTWLDSVRVAKRAWPDLPSHRLNVLSAHLGIAHTHHDALSDARAAGFVIVKAIEHTGMSLAEWSAPSLRRRAGPAPRPAADGPLRGQRVAILGDPVTGGWRTGSRRSAGAWSARSERRRPSWRSSARHLSATASGPRPASDARRRWSGREVRSASSRRGTCLPSSQVEQRRRGAENDGSSLLCAVVRLGDERHGA